ncbi:MAG TPA: SDR family oxidoreductase [Bryobacteraceae bacterium]|nr:SDR family oxidoreductase [Bryobacteraceae bacterium]
MRFPIKAGARAIAIRALTDFVLVHISVIAALAAAVTCYLILGMNEPAQAVAGYFPLYYWAFFWPLSLVFPAVFLAARLYTRSATYTPRYKTLVLLRGIAAALMMFLIANYLVFRDDLVSRSVVIWFALILTVTMVGSRYVKNALMTHFASDTRSGPPVVSEPGVVLVVGGAGYIGSILVRRLLDTGWRVRVFDNLLYGCSAIEDVLDHPNLKLVAGDCRNIQAVVGAVKGVSTIIHLAAIVGDPACEQERLTALETNAAATRMMIEIAKGYGVKRFIFASSCSVYGVTENMVDERSGLNPVSLYAQTKVDSEEALLSARSNSFHPTILRFATVFGNSYRPRFDLVVNLLTAKAHQEGIVTIFNGEQWRPFVHVRDLSEAILKVMYAPIGLVSGEIFNVGSRNLNYTLSQVADKIKEVFPDLRIEYVENSDRRNYRVSFDKLRNLLGFECLWSLEDGILELKHAFERGLIADYRDPFYSNQKYLQTVSRPPRADEVDARVMAAFAAPFSTGTAAPAAAPQPVVAR